MPIRMRANIGVSGIGIGNTGFSLAQEKQGPGLSLPGIFEDPSAITLLISNLIVLGLAIAEGWNLIVIMLVYWAQSVIIGFFNFLKILTWNPPTTVDNVLSDIQSGGKKLPNPLLWAGKIFLAGFFAIHYGGFHLGYLLFILSGIFVMPFAGAGAPAIDWLMIAATSAIFFANHLFSFIYNFKRDNTATKPIMQIMFSPYARIIPMHLTIIFGSMLTFFFGSPGLATILFLLLKTAADMKMHADGHSG